MRKFIAFLATLTVCIAFCGCGANTAPAKLPDEIVLPSAVPSAAQEPVPAASDATAAQSVSPTAAQSADTPAATSAAMPSASPSATEPLPSPTGTPAWQAEGARTISTWITYWETADVIDEIAPYADKLSALCYFEVFFAPDGSFIIPEALSNTFAYVESVYPGNKWDSYVTFVNDLRYENGSFDLKSTDIIEPFLRDDAAIEAHADALIDFAINNNFDGIEIDYEALRKAPELWEPFTRLVSKLYQRTRETGLKLRIVLEPYAPFAEYVFPKGPDYVIMCYNLHGGHSDEGPKADYDFLSMLLTSGSALPGKRIYALATGGYDWDEKGDATQVTLREAYNLFTQFGTEATMRDPASDVLSFNYKDEEGHKHTVWFADTRTLASWTEYMTTSGFAELAYWRLGGNYVE